jgi:hypothetical protein
LNCKGGKDKIKNKKIAEAQCKNKKISEEYFANITHKNKEMQSLNIYSAFFLEASLTIATIIIRRITIIIAITKNIPSVPSPFNVSIKPVCFAIVT